MVLSFRTPKRSKRPKRLQIPFIPNPLIDGTRDPAMGNLVFGSAERPGNPIDAAEVPIVRYDDVAIGQGARPTERPDKNSAQAALAARNMDPDETWQAGRPRTWPHGVR